MSKLLCGSGTPLMRRQRHCATPYKFPVNRFAQKRLCRGFLAAAFFAGAAFAAQEAKPTDEQRPPIPITEVNRLLRLISKGNSTDPQK
jgi:hypothetical protein